MVGSLNLTALLLILPPLPTELRLRLSQQPRCLAAAVCTRSFLPQTPTLVLLPKDPRQPGGHLLRALPGSRMDPGLDQVGCSCTLLYTLLLPFLATAAPAGAAGSCCRSRHLRRRSTGKAKLMSKLLAGTTSTWPICFGLGKTLGQTGCFYNG